MTDDLDHIDRIGRPTMCQACEEGDHDNCGMQTWCQCDCGGYHDAGLPDFDPMEGTGSETDNYEYDPEDKA